MEFPLLRIDSFEKPLWKVRNTLHATAVISLERTAVCYNHGTIESLPQQLNSVASSATETINLLLQLMNEDVGSNLRCLLEVLVGHQETVKESELSIPFGLSSFHHYLVLRKRMLKTASYRGTPAISFS
jgi:hypothetical protein